ncbi:MAG: DNA/RNA nuclease SfsA [Vulcanisaeta sp. AZ3]|jgi:sugar fermentation stimulation protein A|nr:MAG: sugar fermentation stimulation protein [Vulcanisaeta sp. AZ3]
MLGYVVRRPDVVGVFVRRLNRFVGVAVINGEEVMVHIHDPGRLQELLRPGVRIYAYEKSGGKTRYYLVAVDLGDELVLVNSAIHNDIASWLISNGFVLRDYRVVRREPVFGSGRFDLLLRSPMGMDAFVEVKGVTLEVNGIAEFPDAPTQRGARHMMELARAVGLGYEAYVLFLVLRSRAFVFRPNEALDSRFAEAFRFAMSHGVNAVAYKLVLGRDWVLRPVGPLRVEF